MEGGGSGSNVERLENRDVREQSGCCTGSVFWLPNVRRLPWIAFAYVFTDSSLFTFRAEKGVHKKVYKTVTEYLKNTGRVCFGILFQKVQLGTAWAGHGGHGGTSSWHEGPEIERGMDGRLGITCHGHSKSEPVGSVLDSKSSNCQH